MRQKLNVRWYDSIDSTNLQAVRESDTAPDKYVWAAGFQTAGRGQRGNKWIGEKGMNLAFTIFFRPLNLHPSKQFLISEISALGVCAYLSGKGVEAEIKWPNDIYVGDKKICGMLIEHSISSDKISYSISGIGINLNQRVFGSDAPNPTSLSLVKYPDNMSESRFFDIEDNLNEVLCCIFDFYDMLNTPGGIVKIEKEYLSKMYRRKGFHFYEELSPDCAINPVNTGFISEKKGEACTDGAGKSIIEAKIAGIDENYCLLLEQRNGVRKSYTFKEVKFLL